MPHVFVWGEKLLLGAGYHSGLTLGASCTGIMEITSQVYPTGIVLNLSGHFDFASRDDLQGFVKSAVQDQHKKIILDLSQVISMDSASIGMLLVRFRELKNDGVVLQLTHFHKGLAEKKTAVTLSQTIPTFSSNEEALAS
jgi:anti-anti-sigma factor